MRRGSITEHDMEVVSQHQIPCGDCTGLATTAGVTPRCGRCRGTGRVGNCADCNGLGFLRTSSDSGGGPAHSQRSCYRCGGKGWVGNCALCTGWGILGRGDSYAVCPICSGHGHLHQRFYADDPIHGVAIVRVGDAGRFFVPLGEAPVVFGRWAPPNVFVRLVDVLMTKRHFEIHWHPTGMTHEVIDYGRYSLRVNGEFLAGAHDRVRLYGDRPWESDRRSLADRDVLHIGQYLIQYIAHLNHEEGGAGEHPLAAGGGPAQ